MKSPENIREIGEAFAHKAGKVVDQAKNRIDQGFHNAAVDILETIVNAQPYFGRVRRSINKKNKAIKDKVLGKGDYWHT